MATTQEQLNGLISLSFNYLSGDDLLSWCDPQLLIARLNIQPKSLVKAVNTAISEVRSKLVNQYDLTTELAKQNAIPALATASIDATAHTVTGTRLWTGGAGYIAPPTVTVVNAAKDTTGSGATVTAEVSNSIISAVQVLDMGRRYTSPPTVTFLGGGGDGATANAIVKNGYVVYITVTNGGSGYTSIPQVTLEGGGGNCAKAAAVVKFGSVTALNITNAGTLYTLPPSLVFSSDEAVQILDPRVEKLVKIISIFAVRNLLGNAQSISDKMQADFDFADGVLQDIKGGVDNLPLYAAAKAIRSELKLISDSFKQIG